MERVKAQKCTGEYGAALSLLLAEINSQERVSIEKNWGVAPWHYEQAAIIYRKVDDPNAEISILERFMAQRHARALDRASLRLGCKKRNHGKEPEAFTSYQHHLGSRSCPPRLVPPGPAPYMSRR